MNKFWAAVGLAAVLLSGCAQAAMETVSDSYQQREAVSPKKIQLEIPEEAAESVMQNDIGEKMYLCGDYELRLQTLPAGNLTGAFRTVTGHEQKDLTVMTTRKEALTRYDCVWCTAGETGDQIGRTVIMDDGNYYYCISLLADTGKIRDLKETWNGLLDSVSLV